MSTDQRKIISFNVFAGGSCGQQVEPFTNAFSQVQLETAMRLDIRLNLWKNKEARTKIVSEEELFEWLGAEGNIHVILGHIHQGNGYWSPLEIQHRLPKLSKHVGWPSGDQLKCPVLSQDKFAYISKCKEICIPTLMVEFGIDCIDSILDFTSMHNEGYGWICKLPYSTNGEGLSFCKTVDEVVLAIAKKERDHGTRLPYSLIQPCLENRKEYKVVLLGGRAVYVANIAQRRSLGRPFSQYPHMQLKLLAEEASEMLQQRCSGSIFPLLRVDIMQSQNGLVVNEFESLDACYSSLKFEKDQMMTQNYLEEFWYETLINLVAECEVKDDCIKRRRLDSCAQESSSV